MNTIPDFAEELFRMYDNLIYQLLLGAYYPVKEWVCKKALSFPRALPIELKGIAV